MWDRLSWWFIKQNKEHDMFCTTCLPIGVKSRQHRKVNTNFYILLPIKIFFFCQSHKRSRGGHHVHAEIICHTACCCPSGYDADAVVRYIWTIDLLKLVSQSVTNVFQLWNCAVAQPSLHQQSRENRILRSPCNFSIFSFMSFAAIYIGFLFIES